MDTYRKGKASSYEPVFRQSQSDDAFEADTQTRVLVADDHTLLAEAIANALTSAPRAFAASIAGTLNEALETLKSEPEFDLVLLDIRMPGMNGLKSVESVIEAAFPASVVLLSGQADRTFVTAAVEKGALGLIPKTLPLRSLASAIDLVLSGQVFIPATGLEKSWNAGSGKPSLISDREMSIVRYLADGWTNKEIANEFEDSETNVKMHMRSICRKLKARNRTHVVMMCKERGLI